MTLVRTALTPNPIHSSKSSEAGEDNDDGVVIGGHSGVVDR